jgi:hypothetical protein
MILEEDVNRDVNWIVLAHDCRSPISTLNLRSLLADLVTIFSRI